MPIDKEVTDLMPVESGVRPTFMDVNRSSTNNSNEQLRTQLTNGFTDLADAFGQSFGGDFAKSFNNLAKHSNKGQLIGSPSTQRFVHRRATLPMRLKNLIKNFQ